MMESDYKVLYRKYRPSNFNEIVGQKYTVSMLKNAILNDKLSHAYIFTGPRGTGKTSTAKIFAKTINCEHLIDGIPCGECNSCLNINNNADIIEIDAASNNGVDEIRELINNVKIAPSFSKYKVYIIDEVHMLSQSAFNALLLTLEEPPAHIVFILATTNIENVPITILSRCQRYDFKKIEDEDIVEHLKNVTKKEKIEITEDAIHEITYLSDGGLRDALSILNQLSTSTTSITLDTVLENYGSVSMVQIRNIIQYFLMNDYNNLKIIFDNLTKSSIDYKTFIKKMIDELFIEAISLKNDGNDQKYSFLKSIVFELNDLINKININIDPFLLIFMIFVENMTLNQENYLKKEDFKAEKIVNEDKTPVSHNIEKFQDESDSVLSEKEAVEFRDNDIYESLIPIRINNCFAEADKNQLIKFKENWKKFVKNISSSSVAKNFVIDCDVVLASSKINIVVHPQNSVVELFNKNLIDIENEYKDNLNINIKFIALTQEDWEMQKKEYVKKLKDGYVYTLIEEPETGIEESKLSDISEDEEKKSDNIIDIFDKSKVEIK